MAGSHIATTPYCTITPKGSGPVVGFGVGFSLGTLHIESVCHALYVVGGLKGATPYHTITLTGGGPVVGF